MDTEEGNSEGCNGTTEGSVTGFDEIWDGGKKVLLVILGLNVEGLADLSKGEEEGFKEDSDGEKVKVTEGTFEFM